MFLLFRFPRGELEVACQNSLISLLYSLKFSTWTPFLGIHNTDTGHGTDTLCLDKQLKFISAYVQAVSTTR